MPAPTYDPHRFDSGRYTDDTVRFWVDRFRTLADIGPEDVVVDVGCGTGGFTDALGGIGVERSGDLVAHGRVIRPELPLCRAAAEALPVADASADVVIASLLVHQLDDVAVAIDEFARVLRGGGRLLVRTITPDDAAEWVPHRWFPTVAADQRTRMPEIAALERQLAAAGFASPDVTTVERESVVDADKVLQTAGDVIGRYWLRPDEVERGMSAIRVAHGTRYVRRHAILVAQVI